MWTATMYCCAIVPQMAERLPLTGESAQTQTRHSGSAARDDEFSGYFSSGTDEVSAHRHVTLGSNFYLHYRDARKKLLRKASVTDKMKHCAVSRFCGPLLRKACR